MSTATSMRALEACIERLGNGQLPLSEGLPQIRTHYQVLAGALPEPFQTVLDDILDRMESGALFTEESCSFSQSQLQAQLELWLEKAVQKLSTHL
jgi:exonuclease VII small subunit